MFLLGQFVVRVSEAGIAAGRIVETEAYPLGDLAAHAYRRMTKRNRSLFMRRGTAYVYRAYGISLMLNVASEAAGEGAGVLIRAIEPRIGVELMQHRRGAVAARDIARGPGRVAQALDITASHDGGDLCSDGQLYLSPSAEPVGPIGVSTRIGITRAVEAPWRYFVRGNRNVSGPGWLNQ